MTAAPTPLRGRPAPHRLALVLAAVFLAVIAIAAALVARYDVIGKSSNSSAVQGSGIAATQTRELRRFSGVELAGSNNVVVRVGGEQSVVVHADDNLLRHVTTQVQAGKLVIGNRSGSFTTKSPMSVDVSVPSLEALILNGSGVVSATGIKSSILTVTLSGSGVLRASGSATRLDITLGGSGDAQLERVAARDVHAVVSGSGRILVSAINSLDASVPGSGEIVYSGNPVRVTTNIEGNGSVTPG
jgi:Putative auto-transporter adhesin, head GIN domain